MGRVGRSLNACLAPAAPVFCAAALGLGALWGPALKAQVYQCESPTGVPEYTNTPRPNCARLLLAPSSTAPMPGPSGGDRGVGSAPRAGASAPPAASPVFGESDSRKRASSVGTVRVDPALQKVRDADRRKILEDELSQEEARLATLRRDVQSASNDRAASLREAIVRAEGNVRALQREIAVVRP